MQLWTLFSGSSLWVGSQGFAFASSIDLFLHYLGLLTNTGGGGGSTVGREKGACLGAKYITDCLGK